MRAAFVFCLLVATPAAANPELSEFMGAHGCTLGADSRAAAEAAGFGTEAVEALVAESLADGRAAQEGNYVVLDETICTIRLPVIESAYSVSSPEIIAITSAVDAFAGDDAAGCFLDDPVALFDTLKGGPAGAGFSDFISFVGAGLIEGDLRFYSPSILKSPFGFQSLAGPCANVPEREDIDRSHAALVTGFGAYVRALGAETPCDGDKAASLPFDQSVMARFTATVQGVDPEDQDPNRPNINAWLWFEYDLIAMAAGWHEGMSGVEKGTPRPPLCHYD